MHPTTEQFVPRTLRPLPAERSSRASRQREAKAYWDRLTHDQEAWVLRKMGFQKMGRPTAQHEGHSSP